MDIKKMLTTYLHVNDPKLQQVTKKFAIFVVLVAATGGVLWAAGAFEAPTADPSGPQAGEAGDTGTPETTWECMDGTDLATWEAEHPEFEVLERRFIEGGQICVRHTTG